MSRIMLIISTMMLDDDCIIRLFSHLIVIPQSIRETDPLPLSQHLNL